MPKLEKRRAPKIVDFPFR